MNWPTVLCTACAAGCLTLSGVHAAIWLRGRAARQHLAFSALAFSVALFTWGNLRLVLAETPADVIDGLWRLNFSIFAMVVLLVVVVRLTLPTARMWLGHLAWTLRLAALVANIARPGGLDYDAITAMHPISFMGSRIYVADGVTSPWHWFGQLSLAALAAFIVDASYRLWRTGDPVARRRVLLIGLPAAVFVVGGAGSAALIFGGIVQWPHVEFVGFLGLLAAMGYELSSDVLRAAALTRDLEASERAGRELSGRLITAQEDERQRIARDLHDDISQRLSLISLEVALAERRGAAAGDTLGEVAAAIREVASEIHRLSHRLHPAKLDQLGLETSVRAWCRDVTEQTGVSVECVPTGVLAEIPPEAALCAYRIVQEALQNVVRHSQAKSARVELHAAQGRLAVTIADSGRGFDQQSIHTGLGLLSMRERARLAGGILHVRSRPGAGTTIEASIPVTIRGVPAR